MKDTMKEVAVQTVAEAAKKPLGTVKKQLDQAAENFKDRLDQAAEDVKVRIDQAAEAAGDFFHETRRAVRREIRQGKEAVEDLTYEVEHEIRRHPWRSVLIALGTGVVFGWALGQVLNRRA